MAGDVLARGAKSATFGMPSQITQERWDAIWADERPKAIMQKRFSPWEEAEALEKAAKELSGKNERILNGK